MPQDRQWLVNTLRRLGYPQAAEDAARELPEQVPDRHGLSRDEVVSRMGGSP